MLEEDQASFHRWLVASEELRHLIDDPRVPTWEDQQRWFLRCQDPDRALFSLLALPGHTLIGNGGLVDIDRAAGSAQFRITIGNRDYVGRGYGTEATVLILRYAFETLGVQNVRLRVLSENARALRLYEKVGFRRVGEEAGEDGRRAKVIMEIRRSDFHPHIP